MLPAGLPATTGWQPVSPETRSTRERVRSGKIRSQPANRLVILGREKMFAPADFLDLEHTAHPKLFENQNYVWDALKQITSYLQFRLKPAVLGELLGKPFISNHVFIGRGTIVEQGAVLKGPAWIGLLRARKRNRRQCRGDGKFVRIQKLHPLR